MDVTRHKLIQYVEVSKEPSNINCISWSMDNRLAVVTNGCVTVVTINGVDNADKRKTAKLKLERSMIASEMKYEDYDVGVRFCDPNEYIPMLSDSPCHSTANIDPALCPNILKHSGLLDVSFAKWSPVGCDKIGRSVLAVLTRTNKLALYAVGRMANKWKEIINLSECHYNQLKKENFLNNNVTLKGKLPPEIRTKIGNEKTWKDFHEWQNRKYLLNFTCIEWCPSPIVCPHMDITTSSKFVFLATVVKSGNLFIWQGLLPLVNSVNSMQRVLAAHTSLSYPCSLAWSRVNADGTSYLACGSTSGLIKVFFVKTSSTPVGLPRISFVKAYTFLDNQDDRSVDCLTWYAKENKLFLACSKGPHVSLFHTQLMKGGSLSKPVQQVITGVHLLNVTALTITPSGTLLSTSAEGTVQQFKVGSRERSTLVECNIPSGFGCVGLAVSPNGVFMAVLENRRKLFIKKRNTLPPSGCQIAIMSLITEEENNQQLMSCTSRPVDVPQLWDRFFFQEMFTRKLSDSFIFSDSFEGFSQSHLQFLRNVLASNPRWRPSEKDPNKVETGETAVVIPEEQGMSQSSESTDVDMASAEDKVAPSAESLDMVKKIEKTIAGLVMQKVLTAFLQCQKRMDSNDMILSKEPLIWGICRWLAQKCTTQEVTELLEKTWVICNRKAVSSESSTENQMEIDLNSTSEDKTNLPSGLKEIENLEHPVDVRQEILANNDVLEKCLCGQPVILEELRFGRCATGHVWPRCCVTFKLLEGTNCRVCQNCTAHALIQNPSQTPKCDWTKGLLKDSLSCSYCGGWFQCSQ